MSRILVTGASGLIGRRVTGPLIVAGHEVHGVARVKPSDAGSVVWHQHDLLSSPNVVDEVEPEILIHLAWDVTPGRFWDAPENRDWVNASLALAERFATVGGRRFVGAGTCAEYDWLAQVDGVLSEARTPLAPSTLYGQCKDQLRERCEHLADERGIDFAWGRIFFLYAPDEDRHRLFGSVARALLAAETAPTSPGDQIRDFLHADDVGAALAALSLALGVTGAVNVGSGIGVSVRELVEEIGRATGRSDLLRVGALRAVSEPPRIVAEVERLRAEVGFSPAYGLRTGIQAAVRSLASS